MPAYCLPFADHWSKTSIAAVETPTKTLEAGEEVFTSYTPDQARQLAKALLLAADVLEDVA